MRRLPLGVPPTEVLAGFGFLASSYMPGLGLHQETNPPVQHLSLQYDRNKSRASKDHENPKKLAKRILMLGINLNQTEMIVQYHYTSAHNTKPRKGALRGQELTCTALASKAKSRSFAISSRLDPESQANYISYVWGCVCGGSILEVILQIKIHAYRP